jgi:hypothetical protein
MGRDLHRKRRVSDRPYVYSVELISREMGSYIRAKYVEGRWLSPERRALFGLAE